MLRFGDIHNDTWTVVVNYRYRKDAEELSAFYLRASNLRGVHETSEEFEEAAVLFVVINLKHVVQGLSILETQRRKAVLNIHLVNDYSIDNFSDKVLRIIQS